MAAPPMSAEKFWRIIERAAESDHDPGAHVNALRTSLLELSLEEIISFEAAFRRYLNEAYTWDLWGAAYVIHGGCSNDGFEYFRRWLVSRGRDVYEAALTNPDSLAQLDVRTGPSNVYWEFEEIYYVAMEAFNEKGGEGDVRDHSEPEAGASLTGREPSGEPFPEDEEHLAQRYPKLWQRFGAKPLG
jgi:hypothetical protein